MDRSIALISIFIQVSDFIKYDIGKNPMRQNFSPNQNYFHIEEVISTYLFGIRFGLVSVKEIHSYICEHYKEYFPKIPNYNAFNYRLNRASHIINDFSEYILTKSDKTTDILESIKSIDSMPIIVSKKTRKKDKISPDDKLKNGYCSSKDLHFFGAKIHFAIVNQKQSLGKPFIFKVLPANTHDLSAAKTLVNEFKDCTLIADKAYISKKFKSDLNKNNVKLITPVKLSKNKKILSEDEKIFNKVLSSRRQSVEIFFSWIIRKTNIQKASLIRSITGFSFFVYSRIAIALMMLKEV